MVINSQFPVQVTPNFSTSEVAIKSHVESTTFFFDDRLFKIAQYLRDETGEAVDINSAVRSPEYNQTIGGARESQHIYGKALDLSGPNLVRLVTTAYEQKNEVWQRLQDLGLNGLGIYDTFIHVDVRKGNFAFWISKKKTELFWYVAGFLVWFFMLKRFKK